MRKPDWLKISMQGNEHAGAIRRQMRAKGLHTVCEQARCPNLHECWAKHKTATFLVLGDVCSRNCRFCSVQSGRGQAPDENEPWEVAAAVGELGLSHVVITMVTRDDLHDGGASHLVKIAQVIRQQAAEDGREVSIELLVSDMQGKDSALETLMNAPVEVMSHNLETVSRLSFEIRPQADYERSLKVLRSMANAAEKKPDESKMYIKSSIMIGLGETRDEIEQSMDDLLEHGVQLLNIGQYLQPTSNQLPVKKFYHPDEFASLRETAMAKGFLLVHSGPLVRSSYHAGDDYSTIITSTRRFKARP
ncbi:MAG: lipoyl synthase [Spirochaetaceae bacterium]|nr:MAG: lipoyl synthase [Spirochaetaceae bacterium]